MSKVEGEFAYMSLILIKSGFNLQQKNDVDLIKKSAFALVKRSPIFMYSTSTIYGTLSKNSSVMHKILR